MAYLQSGRFAVSELDQRIMRESGGNGYDDGGGMMEGIGLIPYLENQNPFGFTGFMGFSGGEVLGAVAVGIGLVMMAGGMKGGKRRGK